jgi:hypothetical protein
MSVTIKGQQLSFATKSRNGLRYEFGGHFLPTEIERNNGRFNDDRRVVSPALHGVLRTLRGDHVIRSEELVFFLPDGGLKETRWGIVVRPYHKRVENFRLRVNKPLR